MSALPPKADILRRDWNVRYGPKATTYLRLGMPGKVATEAPSCHLLRIRIWAAATYNFSRIEDCTSASRMRRSSSRNSR